MNQDFLTFPKVDDKGIGNGLGVNPFPVKKHLKGWVRVQRLQDLYQHVGDSRASETRLLTNVTNLLSKCGVFPTTLVCDSC